MKLRNKTTGEIGNLISTNWNETALTIMDKDGVQLAKYTSLAELNTEWEDYEEPKTFFTIYYDGMISEFKGRDDEQIRDMKEIGNYFDTREEAEEAVEKLKAIKILKDNGFRFIQWEFDMRTIADGKIWFDVGVNTQWDAEQLLKHRPEVKESLDLLFGGEE